VLNFSDGNHSLLDIAERSGLDFKLVQQAANALVQARLLKRSA
jgi:aminopeptidase-like protein